MSDALPAVPEPDPWAVTPDDPEDPLRDRKKRYLVKLLASGYTPTQAAKTTRMSLYKLRRWLGDKLFQREVEIEKSETKQVAETAKDAFVPRAIAVAAAELDSPDLRTRMKAQAEIRKWHLALKPTGPQVAVQNNTQVVNLYSVAAAEAPRVRSVREFVVEDLGRAETELYPRVMFLLEQIDRLDVREVILMMAKGSGKSILLAISMARALQRVLVHDSPQRTYGHAVGQLMGAINLSVTQTQAQLAVFRTCSGYVQNSPWFQRYATPSDFQLTQARFPRDVIAFCGNSQAKGVEGINWFCAVADEVCRLPEVGVSGDTVQRADDLVRPVRNTLNTRFPRDRKLVLASWPEHTRDFLHIQIENALKSGVAEDLTERLLAVPVTRVSPADEAAYTALWADEPFRKYPPSVVLTNDGTLVVKGPAWAFNPNCDVGVARREWGLRPREFACEWAASPDRQDTNPYFRDPDAFARGANSARRHPIRPDGKFEEWFKGSGEHLYYAHIDIGVTHDAAGIAVGHYDSGRCVYDLLLEVKPPSGGEIRIKGLRQVLYDMERLGFTFGKVTQDGFQGLSSKQELEEHGIASEIFSVDRGYEAYDTFRENWYEGRLDYYPSEPLFQCVRDLVDTGKKVDHTRLGKKDLADSAAAVAFHVFEQYGGRRAK